MKVNISIDDSACKGCGICLTVCQKKVYAMSKNRNNYGSSLPEVTAENECIVCRLCERMCPDGAINVEEERK